MARTRHETILITPDVEALESKKALIISQIYDLEANLADAKNVVANKNDIEARIDELMQIKNNLIEDVEALKLAKDRVISEKNDIVEIKRDELYKVIGKVNDSNIELEKIKDMIREKSNALNTLQSDANTLEQNIVTLNSTITQLKSYNESLENQSLELKNLVSSLDEQRARANESLSALQVQVLDKTNECNTLSEYIHELKKAKNSLVDEVQAVREERDDIVTNIKSEKDTWSRQYKEQVKYIEDRMGEITVRENILEKKKKDLVLYRKRLEVFYNKPLDSEIII